MIAGAFDNVALLDRLDETNRELEALVDSSLEFGSTLELDRVLLAIASRIREVAGANAATSTRYEQGHGPRPGQRLAGRRRRRRSPESSGIPSLYSVRMLVETSSRW